MPEVDHESAVGLTRIVDEATTEDQIVDLTKWHRLECDPCSHVRGLPAQVGKRIDQLSPGPRMTTDLSADLDLSWAQALGCAQQVVADRVTCRAPRAGREPVAEHLQLEVPHCVRDKQG